MTDLDTDTFRSRVEAHLAADLDLTDEEPEVGEERDEAPQVQEEPVSVPEHPAEEQASPETYRLGDLELSAEQAAGLADFYRWAQQNPQQVAAIDAYLAGSARLVPVDERPGDAPDAAQSDPTTTPADDIDWDDLDPAVAARLRRLEELEQTVGTLTQAQQQQQLAMAQAVIRRGAANFQQRFNLSDPELDQVMQTTAQLQILPGLASASGDSIRAVEEALETAYWRMPDFRQREIDRHLHESGGAEARKRKAAALSGSSGTVPRTSEHPNTPEGRKAAMADEIRAALQDGSLSTG